MRYTFVLFDAKAPRRLGPLGMELRPCADANKRHDTELEQAPSARHGPSSGRVAEWSNAPVLKTGDGQPSVGSNPTPSATIRH